MTGYVGLHDKSSGNFGTKLYMLEEPIIEKNEYFLKEIKKDLLIVEQECFQRGLLHSKKW